MVVVHSGSSSSAVVPVDGSAVVAVDGTAVDGSVMVQPVWMTFQ